MKILIVLRLVLRKSDLIDLVVSKKRLKMSDLEQACRFSGKQCRPCVSEPHPFFRILSPDQAIESKAKMDFSELERLMIQ